MNANKLKNSADKLVNYAYVSKDQIEEWKARGFKEDEPFALELWDEPGEYIVMTRDAISLLEYGKERLIGCEIDDLCSFIGSYGMGGPGYFGFKINTQTEDIWIVICLWNADGYMHLDDRVFHKYNHYIRDDNQWYSSHNSFIKYFKPELCKAKIKEFIINKDNLIIVIEIGNKIRQIKICNNHNTIGSRFIKEDTFSNVNIIDSIMVIPDHSNIFISD